MTDKDEIKFAIRYLKQGLKSKRTPPLYEELMNELGFVKKDIDRNIDYKCDTCISLKMTELEKENAELKKQNSKAKELLTRFVMASVYFNGKEIDLIAEAESFLKGEKLFI